MDIFTLVAIMVVALVFFASLIVVCMTITNAITARLEKRYEGFKVLAEAINNMAVGIREAFEK